MSSQAAGACERAAVHHPLRVLLSAGQPEPAQLDAAGLGLSLDVAISSDATLWAGCGVPTLAAACTGPSSRSYETALVAGLPLRGP